MPLKRLLRQLFPAVAPRWPAPPRLSLEPGPDLIYAIGDVHGCLDLLQGLERQIAEDAADTPGDRLIVMLGDLIDRGPASAEVIEHMQAPPPAGFRRLCLRGNHEQMLLGFLRQQRDGAVWLANGGWKTIASYGASPTEMAAASGRRAAVDLLLRYIPHEHIDWLSGLPVLIETPEVIFAHAGIRPGVAIADQTDDDLMWFRDDYADDFASARRTVVHGHTPRDEPLVTPFRIAIDTGACLTGKLTAVRLARGQPPALLSTSGSRLQIYK